MMIVKKQKLMLIASVLLIVLYLGRIFYGDFLNGFFGTRENCYMDIPSISKEQLDKIIDGKEEKILEDGIFFNYSKAPMDIKEQTVFISQSAKKEDWEGIFSIEQSYRKEGYDMYFLEDDLFDDKQEAIKQGHEFLLYIVGEDYYKLKVVFSGLGVFSISKQYELPKEEIDYFEDPDAFVYDSQPEYIGEVTVLAAEGTETFQTISSYVKYHVKGATSASNPKKSYAITFVDEGGKDVSLPVLGMDSYAKWKLNALYNDNTLLREKSACDIWQSIDNYNQKTDNGSFGAEYVELILDGEYAGVYLLVEPVDGEKLELDNNDVLYKCLNWDIASQEKIEESIAQKWRIQFPFRIRYPKVIADYQAAWSPLKDFSRAFWDGGITGDTSLQQRVDISNIIDVEIFLEICALSDNSYKNMYYAAHVNEDGTYTMSLHPWDLDLSFGHRYTYGQEGSYEFQEYPGYFYGTTIFGLITNENPDIGSELYNTYKEYREGIISDEAVADIISANWDDLQNSGAYARNLRLWEIAHGDSHVDTVLEYVRNRFAYMDAVYQERYNKK